MRRKTNLKGLISMVLILTVILSAIAILPASAASSGYNCTTPAISPDSIIQRGQSIGFKWYPVVGATRYRVYYKVTGGSWTRLGDTTGTQWYDTDLSRICKGAYYTVRCISTDGSQFVSDYNHSGTWIKAYYYSTPNPTSIKVVNWNEAYLYFEANPNAIEEGSRFQVYMKNGKNGSWSRISSTLTTVGHFSTVCTDYDGKQYYPTRYRAEIVNDSVPYPGETYYYTVRCIGKGWKLLDDGSIGYGEIFTSMYNDNDAWYIYHTK